MNLSKLTSISPWGDRSYSIHLNTLNTWGKIYDDPLQCLKYNVWKIIPVPEITYKFLGNWFLYFYIIFGEPAKQLQHFKLSIINQFCVIVSSWKIRACLKI